MSKSSKRYFIHLTEEAINSLNSTFVSQYIHWDRFLVCKEFKSDFPMCYGTATPNDENKNLSIHGFFLPHAYILYVAIADKPSEFGFVPS